MKFRKIVFTTLFLLICANVFSMSDKDGAICGAAESGANLEGVPSGDLQGAADAARKGGFDNAANIIQNELDRRNAEIAKLEALAKEAEQALAELEESIAKLENDIKVKEAELGTKEGEALEAVKQEIENQKAELAQKKAQVEQAANNMSNAYKKLSEAYEQYNITGDPVRIGTGKFTADYEDFIPFDYGSKFTVKRSLRNDGYGESFGKNWFCSLDSRIVRCVTEPLDKTLEDLLVLQKTVEVMNMYCDAYSKKYPQFYGEKIEEIRQKAAAYKEKYDYLIEITTKQNIQNYKNKELNKYVTYGRFSNLDNYIFYDTAIVFLTEEGSYEYYVYKGNGIWKALVESVSQNKYVQGLLSNGSYSNTEDASGGFIVCCENGYKRYFNVNGLPVKDVDTNGNITRYEITNGFVSGVVLKTGEKLSIVRNGSNQITRISGPVSGTAAFSYEGSQLVQVLDNRDTYTGYAYDGQGDIQKIKRSDGSYIAISYEIDSSGRKVCSSVKNENGYTEFFNYDHKNKTASHKTVSGTVEQFKYNDFGNTVYSKDYKGNIVQFETNQNGFITREINNNYSRSFFYDSKNHLVKRVADDGGTESWNYNNAGLVTKITDADGFYTSYNYDSKGNITEIYYCGNLASSMTYYSNGLLKSLHENNTETNYEYNNYGSITKKTVMAPGGRQYTESWTYDNKNRVIKYVSLSGTVTEIEYGDKSYIETSPGNKRTEHFFDERNREVKTVETDLLTNITYTKTTEYDKKNNPVKVFINGELFSEYDYLNGELLSTYTIWTIPEEGALNPKHGIKALIDYDSYGRIVSRSQIAVSEKLEAAIPFEQKLRTLSTTRYEKTGASTIVEEQKGGAKYKFVYSKKGLLTSCTKNDSYTVTKQYSKAGRLISEADNRGNIYSYNYKSDGSFNVIHKIKSGIAEYFYYDEKNQLVKYVDFTGGKYEFVYDWKGNLIEEKRPALTVIKSYDELNRVIKAEAYDSKNNLLYEGEKIYDYNKRSITSTFGKYTDSVCVYDCWGRKIKAETPEGSFIYEYDALGNLSQIKNGRGGITKIEAGPLGIEEVLTTSEGKKIEFFYDSSFNVTKIKKDGRTYTQRDYDEWGNLLSVVNQFGNKTSFEYDSYGLISAVQNYDTGKVRINTFENEVSLVDENGNSYVRSLSSQPDSMKLTNPGGKTKILTLDSSRRISGIKKYSGNRVSFTYGKDFIKKLTETGAGSFTEIQKQDGLGRITELQDEGGKISFTYDDGNRLIQTYEENLNIKIDYGYDKYGRLKTKESDLFKFEYFYDKAGCVSKIKERNSATEVQFLYDRQNRITDFMYSSGVRIHYGYDDFGNKAVIQYFEKNKSVYQEYVLYNSDNKINLRINESGRLEKYLYDAKGRLETVIMSFDDDLLKEEMKEFSGCGGYVPETFIAGDFYNLSGSELSQLKALTQKHNGSIDLPAVFSVWKKSYEYNKTGGVSKEKSKLGTMEYEYDNLNRLVSKHTANSSENGIVFKWNDDNCLLEIKGEKSYTKYTYDFKDRPSEIYFADYENQIEKRISYKYDYFNRRKLVTENGKSRVCIYDGFSVNPLMILPVLSNGRGNSWLVNTEALDSETYRLMDKAVDQDNFRYRTESEVCKEEECGNQLDFTNSDSGISVFLNFGALTVCNYKIDSQLKGGLKLAVLVEDNFGNPWGKSKNLGYRDYNAEMKSFISEDPAGDGGNLFAYCACDPVNYYDSNGYKKTNYTDGQNYGIYSELAQFVKYDNDEAKQNGESMGVPYPFDCADTTAVVTVISEQNAGCEPSSPKLDDFAGDFNDGNNQGARDDICSGDFFAPGFYDNFTKLTPGYDRNLLRNEDKKDTPEYKQAAEDKQKALEALSDPNTITPGTVLVWKSSDYPADGDSGNWVGHTVTILARNIDENGKIVGFVYIEGHTDGTVEVGYTTIVGDKKDEAGLNRIDFWFGEFLGAYEMVPTVDYIKGLFYRAASGCK